MCLLNLATLSVCWAPAESLCSTHVLHLAPSCVSGVVLRTTDCRQHREPRLSALGGRILFGSKTCRPGKQQRARVLPLWVLWLLEASVPLSIHFNKCSLSRNVEKCPWGQVEGGAAQGRGDPRAHGVSGLFQGPLGKPGLPGMPGADGPPVSTLPASPLHRVPGLGTPRGGNLAPRPEATPLSPHFLSPTSSDEDLMDCDPACSVITGLWTHFSIMGSNQGVGTA